MAPAGGPARGRITAIRADKTTEYKIVKKVLADAKDAGMVHVGFMTTGKE